MPKEKFGKLEAYVKKVYGQLGTIRSVRCPGIVACMPTACDECNHRVLWVCVASRSGCRSSGYIRGELSSLGLGCSQEGGFYMPVDNAEVSKGYAFIEFTEASVRYISGSSSHL